MKSAFAARSAARGERRRLEAEIAGYRTPAERTELDLILSRHTAEGTREIDEILRRQAVARHYGR